MLDIIDVSKTFAPGTVNEHIALQNVSLHLDNGEFVTIVGSNGAGKSTLFNMLCGTYIQDKGKIILDDNDISFMPEHKRAKYIGRVFQDPMKGTAPHMTIEENLALAYSRAGSSYFSLAVSPKKRKMFKEYLAAFDMGLEDRMDAAAGTLSGGQRQRLTIARAIMKHVPILILDDSASALDMATDANLRKAIRRMPDHPTVFIVSQRTNAIMDADRILVLDDGKLVGKGKHDELLKTCEIYREIFESQYKKGVE